MLIPGALDFPVLFFIGFRARRTAPCQGVLFVIAPVGAPLAGVFRLPNAIIADITD